jgi:hypothetical protein
VARELPDYDELEFRLTPGRGNAYNVEISSASGARGRGQFAPPSELDIERFRRTVDPRNRRVRGRSRYLEAATQFGTGLFEELVGATSVREVYTTARNDASAAGRGLRVTLSLRAAPELASIPWEFLYDRPRFLAQHVNSPVVRFVDFEDPPLPLRVEAPLRILGMVSRPKDDELATLDAEEEQAALERRLWPLIDSGLVTLRWLARATLPALQQEVDHGEEFHVFHYIGHGEYDEESGHSSLILEHDDRRPRRVGGQQLGALLCDRGSLRLAVLNACEAAQTAPQDPLAGVATSLMEYGVPAVVAMQFAITDDGALTFADEFYGALAGGYAVDAAVTQGRRALAADSDVEWGTPVLFMRVADGRLFDLESSALPPTPETAQSPAHPSNTPALTDRDESREPPVAAIPKGRSGPAAEPPAPRRLLTASSDDTHREAGKQAQREEKERASEHVGGAVAITGAIAVIASLPGGGPNQHNVGYWLPVAVMSAGVIVLIGYALRSNRRAPLIGGTALALALLGVTFPLSWHVDSTFQFPGTAHFWLGACGAALAALGAALASWQMYAEPPVRPREPTPTWSRATRVLLTMPGPLIVIVSLLFLDEWSRPFPAKPAWQNATDSIKRYPSAMILLCAFVVALAAAGIRSNRTRPLVIAAGIACLLLGESVPLIFTGAGHWGPGRWLAIAGAVLAVAGLALAAARSGEAAPQRPLGDQPRP